MFSYIANQLKTVFSLKAQRSTAAAGAIKGTAVDIGEAEGPIIVAVDAPVASSGDTINFTVQHSYTTTDGDFTNVDAATLIDPSTGQAATFTQVTDAVAVSQQLALKRENVRRYIRVVATTAGSSIDVTFAASVSFLQKYF